MPHTVLALNLGSTSTKVGFLCQGQAIMREDLPAEPSADERSQMVHRRAAIETFLRTHAIDPGSIDIIVSRGGLMKPGPSGIYRINLEMCADLLDAPAGRHVSALGPALAFEMARALNIAAVVVDPPSTDEFHDLARFSGIPSIVRTSAFHALNHKATARRAAHDLGKTLTAINLIVAHLGGGISIAAHHHSRVIDATHGLSEGPFSPERAGTLPTQELLRFARQYPGAEIETLLTGASGLYAYLGTKDARDIEQRIHHHDQYAQRVYMAMAYQIAKDIASMAAVLAGDVQAIVLTGGLARSHMLTTWIRERIGFIAPLLVYAGEDEIEVLLEAGFRVLDGEEVLSYPPIFEITTT